MSPRTRARTRSASRESRYELIVGDLEGRRTELARDVERELTRPAKSLPSRWLLDATGVDLLRRLRRAPTSYAQDAERQLLADRAYAAPLYFPNGAPRVIEIGVVDAERTRLLLAPLLETFAELAYTAVGPDRSAVDGPCRELCDAFPGLRATAMVGRLEDAVRDLRASADPVLLFWPHGGVGDWNRLDSISMLRGVGAAMRPRDLLIATADLRKDQRVVQRVYRDRNGLAKRLHLHVLERLNEELGAGFDLSYFRHSFAYDEEAGELESHLVSRRSHVVRIADLDLEIPFAKGEGIHTLTVTKFSPQEIDQAAHAAELVVNERWYDREGRVCANLMRRA